MRMLYYFPIFALFLLLFTCCEPSSNAVDTAFNAVGAAFNAVGAAFNAAPTTTTIDTFMTVLASDDFQGRKPFTEGEAKTIAFLQQQFEKMGLEPGNNGSYFQEVPMVEITPTPLGNMVLKGAKGKLELKPADDIALYTQREDTLIDLKQAPLVFCGYGIVAPEYNWNDYEGLDMKGKIAVVLVNDPGFQNEEDSTIFKGNTMTYYGRWTYKFEEAARQGAAGVMVVHETNAAGYPWFVVKNSGTSPKLNLQSDDGNAAHCAVVGWITITATARIFDLAGLRGTDIYTISKKRDFKAIPLGVTASVAFSNKLKKDKSHNVVGMIKGSERPEEYVIYSAHWATVYTHLKLINIFEEKSRNDTFCIPPKE